MQSKLYDLRYIKIPHWIELFWRKLAWSLPKTLVMWAAVRLMCHATQGEYENQVVPELNAMEALRRWK